MSPIRNPLSAGQRRIVRRTAELAAAAAALLLVLAALATGALIAAGYHPATERSDSMAPSLHRGDVLFSHAIAASKVRIGDVVTFADPHFADVHLTHRVRSEHVAADGRIAFVTRGDADRLSEHFTVAPGAKMTSVAFHVPWAGLPLIEIASYPLYLAIAVAVALWLVLLVFVLRRDAEGHSRARPELAALTIGALLVCGATGTVVASYAASKADVTPSALLAVSDGGSALFTLPAMVPGTAYPACELVTNHGPDLADVGIWGDPHAPGGLDPHLHLVIARGTLPAGAAATTCNGFVADAASYLPAGAAGVLYDGALDGFPTSPGAAIPDPRRSWPVGASAAYRMTLSLVADAPDTAQGLVAHLRFEFGSNPVGSVLPTPTTTTPPPPPPPTPTTPTPTPTPTTPTPTPTTPTTPTTTTPTPPPFRTPGLAGQTGSATTGALGLTLTLWGQAKVTATASLVSTAKLKKGAKPKLVRFGQAVVSVAAAGKRTLTIRPAKAALALYRKSPTRYRMQVVVVSRYAGHTPTTSYTTTFKVSAKTLKAIAKKAK